jgi:hypothetical protein
MSHSSTPLIIVGDRLDTPIGRCCTRANLRAEGNRQFRYIAGQREDFRRTDDPRISVDAKKKEPIGKFKNARQSWRQEAEQGNAHVFGRMLSA